MGKNGRFIDINGTEVTITGMDYDYFDNSENVRPRKFNITFDATVNNAFFIINFSNERLSDKDNYLADFFIGTGEAYIQFLKEVESNANLKDKKQYSDDTRDEANKVIGAIAQSVYIDLQSHSPDQDEE